MGFCASLMSLFGFDIGINKVKIDLAVYIMCKLLVFLSSNNSLLLIQNF